MEDVEEPVDQADRRGTGLKLDIVFNHVSKCLMSTSLKAFPLHIGLICL